jgi:hypothetical protein
MRTEWHSTGSASAMTGSSSVLRSRTSSPNSLPLHAEHCIDFLSLFGLISTIKNEYQHRIWRSRGGGPTLFF